MVHSAKSGHPGGSLSGADILNVLYSKCLNIPKEWDKSPDFKKRDRFILSKGHASPLLYAVLAQKGIIDEKELLTFRKFGSKLQGHPSNIYVKGVETSTGSLGQGLSIGCGVAIGLKLDNNFAAVVVYLGDGELQEGSCWEAFMQAGHRGLDNLIAIIDRNRLQIDGDTEKVMALDNLNDKIRAFNWNVIEINGHDYNQIYDAYNQAKKSTKPCAIIANTIKGKGVSFMENQAGWHGKAPNDEQLEQALKDLSDEV
jgi:transketolase